MIYFDHAATSPPTADVLKNFAETAEKFPFNPASSHKLGVEAEICVKNARERFLSNPQMRNFSKGDFYFTSGATESNNLAIKGSLLNESWLKKFLMCNGYLNRKKIISTEIEHPAVYETLEFLKALQFEVVTFSPKDFKNTDDFKNAILNEIDGNTALVSAMSVNNETGYLIDTEKLYSEIKRNFPKVIFHTDHSQGFMKCRADADLISVSSHKIGGLKNSGGLYLKKGIKLSPLFHGGGQQKSIRSGTESAENSMAFAAAVKFADENYNEKKIRKINEIICYGIKNIPSVIVNNPHNVCLPHIMSINVAGARSEVLVHFFEERKIYISNGSACSSKHKNKKNRVLGAFGIDDSSAIRISFGFENTIEQANIFLDALDYAAKKWGNINFNFSIC